MAMSLTDLLKFSIQQDASDLHLSTGMPPMLRVYGDIIRLDVPPLSEDDTHGMIYGIMTDSQRRQFEQDLECDFSFEIEDVARFRVNAFRQNRGSGAVFRMIPTKVLTMQDLNMPDFPFKGLLQKSRGLILVTGPTGSGKTTTLAALIDEINKTQQAHILTIEDPIEIVYSPVNSLINQREVHRDTHSFANALKSALREDPDIILVGEMRDRETIELALTAAETGHLVFGTLHTSSAAKAINRIVDVFPGEEQSMIRTMISESLQAVIAQALLKKRTGGRVAAWEIMIATSAIRNLIRENKVAQMYSSIQIGSSYGMQTLDQHLKALIKTGVVEKEAALPYATNLADFENM